VYLTFHRVSAPKADDQQPAARTLFPVKTNTAHTLADRTLLGEKGLYEKSKGAKPCLAVTLLC
jgi:hypothetical protein